jgi:hypothetical protein
VLLAHGRLENTWVIKNLVLGMRICTRKTSWTMVFKLDLTGIVDNYRSEMWAKHGRVIVLVCRSSRPLRIVGILALRMPFANARPQQALARL